jgi:transposase
MPQIESWEISDQFWSKVEPLVPVREGAAQRSYRRAPGGGRKPMPARQIFAAIVYVLRTGVPVEGAAQGVWQRQRHPQALSALAARRLFRGAVAGGVGRV